MPRTLEAVARKRKIEETEAAYAEDYSDSDLSLGKSPGEPLNNLRSSTPVHEPEQNFVQDVDNFDFEDEDDDDVDDVEPVVLDASGEDSTDPFEDSDANDTEAGEDHPLKLWQRIASTESCQLSIDDFCACLVAAQVIHKIPDTAMNLFCQLFSNCLPSGNAAPSSYSNVIKRVLPEDIGHSTRFVCGSKNCDEYLQKLFDVCGNSSCRLFGKRQHACGYLRMRIQPQIEAIVNAHYLNICQFLAASIRVPGSNLVGDIPTTPAYGNMGDNPCGDVLWISLIISSDGALAFKCGRSSFWPCAAIIAELPPKVRVAAENSIGLGFWVGRGEKSKPDWAIFLPSIISEIDSLKRGFFMEILGRRIKICVRIFATIFDLPAQASIWGVKQYNGKLLSKIFGFFAFTK